jgi:hypothetical protein
VHTAYMDMSAPLQHPFLSLKSSLWNVTVSPTAPDAVAGVLAASMSGP